MRLEVITRLIIIFVLICISKDIEIMKKDLNWLSEKTKEQVR